MSLNIRYVVNTLGAIFLLTSISFTTQADDAGNIIKYRKGVMKAIAGHMTASGLLVTKNVKFADDLKVHANAIAALTKDMAKLFPNGSDFGETAAKETIWEHMDKFKKLAKDSENAAASFATAATGSDQNKTIEAFKQVGETCKACHKDFRVKE